MPQTLWPTFHSTVPRSLLFNQTEGMSRYVHIMYVVWEPSGPAFGAA